MALDEPRSEVRAAGHAIVLIFMHAFLVGENGGCRRDSGFDDCRSFRLTDGQFDDFERRIFLLGIGRLRLDYLELVSTCYR